MQTGDFRKNLFALIAGAAIFFAPGPCGAQVSGSGENSVAQQYVLWAEQALEQGHWSEALIVLERASDYADKASDLSFLLARTRSHLEKPRGSALEALRRALTADRWDRYTAKEARLLEAEQLIILKSYIPALETLALIPESPGAARLKLLALRFSGRTGEYLRQTLETMNRYPRETGAYRIFFDYLSAGNAKDRPLLEGERELLDLALRRLSVLLPDEPELAWMAAPYMRDTMEAGRLVAAYRAVREPLPASIPAALNLGVIDEERALEELFSLKSQNQGLDMALLEMVWDLLRSEESRDSFRKNLAEYTGVIFQDVNYDGIPEAGAMYRGGILAAYRYDEDQDGLPGIFIHFSAGNPGSAVITMPPPSSAVPAFPLSAGDQRNITLRWEQYPAVLDAEFEGERFLPRPLDFFYLPIRFADTALWSSRSSGFGFLFPEKDPMIPALTRRVLIANSLRVERPSAEFDGAVEVVELNQSIPVAAREYLGDQLVSETDFLRGRPVSQRVDLDLDGRLETTRYFRRFSLTGSNGLPPPEILLDYRRDFDYAESDWAGNGIYERNNE